MTDTRTGRGLILVPIVHSEADLGSLAGKTGRLEAERNGEQAHARKIEVIQRWWESLRAAVEVWDLEWSRVRLYQDGLPRCGRERDIVRSLAEAGSENHRLVLALVERGAMLTGTEDPELLLEEYRMAEAVLSGRRVDAAHAAGLLERRDRYIAGRVNRTLKRGETGLLFLGALHRVEPHLAGDIERLAGPAIELRSA